MVNELRLAAAKSARDLGATRVAFDAAGLIVSVEFGGDASRWAMQGQDIEAPPPRDESPPERQARIDRTLFRSSG